MVDEEIGIEVQDIGYFGIHGEPGARKKFPACLNLLGETGSDFIADLHKDLRLKAIETATSVSPRR